MGSPEAQLSRSGDVQAGIGGPPGHHDGGRGPDRPAPAGGVPLEAHAVGSTPLDMDEEQQARVDLLGWRSACQPWDLARVDRRIGALDDYPVNSRVLPTRLGNVLRATEDRLANADGDLEGFVLRRRLRSPARVVEQHDQFRTCTGRWSSSLASCR